jgi:hypothetical protein
MSLARIDRARPARCKPVPPGNRCRSTYDLIGGFMMVNTGLGGSKQDWSIGKMVKVGFMALKVLGVKAVKDGMPDIYILENPKNGKRYEFIPHYGLSAI